jgi:hypothetical protein
MPSDERRTRRVIQTDARPTSRQVYAVARALSEIAGIEWPESRGAMSELLDHLNEQRGAVPAVTDF